MRGYGRRPPNAGVPAARRHCAAGTTGPGARGAPVGCGERGPRGKRGPGRWGGRGGMGPVIQRVARRRTA
ncbi:hypothetical protein FMM49_30015 [Streptomyces rimosus subsp. rimosus]|nr:hypothetical protein CTZ40_29500 [Streptomyces rimosus]QEV78552.1 hypothetical protein CP984_29465 [Streptomyces rimosus]QTL89392.1 hypothetical protein FMM49_30015 [Streptomyces rimosus subsp. rimosus]